MIYLRNKLLFVGAALTRMLPGPMKDEWALIQGDLSSASYVRNHFAHYQTRQFPNNEEGRRLALCPWHGPKRRNKTKPPPDSYCLRELLKARFEFIALDVKVANFVARGCGETEPFPKSDEQPADLPTIEQIKRQIHEALGHPQLSSREKRLQESALNAAASLIPQEEPDETQEPDTSGTSGGNSEAGTASSERSEKANG